MGLIHSIQSVFKPISGLISFVRSPKGTYNSLFNNRNDQSHSELLAAFKGSRRVAPGEALAIVDAAEAFINPDRSPLSLSQEADSKGKIQCNIKANDGTTLEAYLNDRSIESEFRTPLAELIYPIEKFQADFDEKMKNIAEAIGRFDIEEISINLPNYNLMVDTNPNPIATLSDLHDENSEAIETLLQLTDLNDLDPAYQCPFPPAEEHRTPKEAFAALQKHHQNELQHMQAQLTDDAIIDAYKIPRPITTDHIATITTTKSAIVNAKKTQQADQLTKLAQVASYPYEEAEAARVVNCKPLRDFTQRIATINHLLQQNKVPNYQAMIAFVKQERSKAHKAIEALHEKEYTAFEAALEDKKDSENYANAIAKFYDVDPKEKDLVNTTMDKHHEQLLETLRSKQKSELTTFDKAIASELSTLHEKQLNEEQRIAFCAMMLNKDQNQSNMLQNETIEARGNHNQLTTRSGLQIHYDANKKNLTIDAGELFSFNLSAVGYKLNQARASRELNDLFMAAKASGIKPITITVHSNNPQEAEKLAREAYAAARKNGYSHKDITIELPNKSQARLEVEKGNKEEKAKDPKEWLFNRYPDRLKAINDDASQMQKMREQRAASTEKNQEHTKDVDDLKLKVDTATQTPSPGGH